MTIELVLLSQVSWHGREITGARLRGLLALLAGDPRAGCGTGRLVDALWPDERPAHPTKALQVLVSRARTRLGADLIVSTPAGYRLSLAEDEIDASAVLQHAAGSERRLRAGDPAAALEHTEAGLALCAGAAGWADSAGDPLSALRAARLPAYRSLRRIRALALARLGRPADAVEPLAELIRERPRDEEVLAELLRCEAATVGPATALARYDAHRQALRDELGSDPGPAVQRVHQELLRADTPVVRDGVRHEPNPLLGRDDDLAAVAGLLCTARVTSIVGTGGLGKTRLAHAVSRRAGQRVVRFVPLAGVTADADVAAEVAAALGVGEIGGNRAGRGAGPSDVLAGIANTLGPGPALLVLDNCEHVVRGAADLVHALVSMSPDLRVLTTSRAPLGLSSESVYLLPELSLPTTIELFGQRARAARPGVQLPADAVRELCGHLDGLPLAVELAAARVRVMSVVEIARRLDDRFALLRGSTRDAPDRHRTLHAVIDWSWHLLAPAGQAAMRALSVFPDGFTADAARQLLGAADPLDVLAQLVEQSLLKVTDTGSGARFRMLETVREFSAARRADAGETDPVITGFLAWARDFGVTQHDSIFAAELLPFVEETRAEQDNLVQALRFALDRGDGATVAATAAVLGGLWIIDSAFTRIATLATETAWVLSHFRPAPELVETTRTALVVCTVGGFLVQGPFPHRLLATLRRFPTAPPDTPARAVHVVLRTVAAEGPAALSELCDSAEPLLAGLANYVASFLWERDNQSELALKAARRTLAAFQTHGTKWARTMAHARIGELCLQLDPGEEAVYHLSEALSVVAELRAWSTLTRGRWALVLANLQRGAIDEAEHSLDRALRGDRGETPDLLMFDFAVRAEILLARGEIEAGLGLWRQAVERVRQLETGGDRPGPTPWALELQAVAVVAHAQHGRLDLVPHLTRDLPHTLWRMVAEPAGKPTDLPVRGALLLAMAMVDLDRGERVGDARAIRSGVRLAALAERSGFARGFQPTMSPARAREHAERADRPAYADAVSSYADLDQDGLRAAALAALRAHDRLTGWDPA